MLFGRQVHEGNMEHVLALGRTPTGSRLLNFMNFWVAPHHLLKTLLLAHLSHIQLKNI